MTLLIRFLCWHSYIMGCMHNILSLICKMSHAHGSQDNFEEAVDSEDDYVVDCEEMIMMK